VSDVDVVVVGAGLGGLSAAAHAARQGARVAVLDKNDEIGGFATTYRRGAYRFEGSLHLLDAARPGQPNHAVLVSAGIADRIELRRHSVLHRELWPSRGWDLVVGHGDDGLVDAVGRVRPEACNGVRSLLDAARRAHDLGYRWLEHGDAMEHEAADLLALARVGAEEVLRHHVDDAGAREVIGALAIYQGIGLRRLAALPLLLMLYGYHHYGGDYVVGGSRALSEALAAEVRAHEGTVRIGAEVVGLIVEGGRVIGCRLADGTEIRARSVIAAIAPPVTFGRLLPEGLLPRRWRDRLDRMPLSGSLVRLSLGLRVDPRALGLDDYELFLMDAVECDGERSHAVITLPARLDPLAAPDGHGVLQITMRAQEEWRGGLDGDQKARIGRVLADAVQRHVLPSVADHVEVSDLAHPATFERYGGTPRGAVFGYASVPVHAGARGLRAATPVPGLYLAGGWVFPGSGQTPSLWSGRLAARCALREMT
jgi:phytoene dehydrogenase-like protein